MEPSKPKGRPKGAINRTSADFKYVVSALVDRRIDEVGAWLDDVAKDNPAKAIELILKIAEFAYPRLARQEIVGNSEAPLQTRIVVQYVDPPKREDD